MDATDRNASIAAAESNPVVKADAPTPKPIRDESIRSTLLNQAVLACTPIVNVGLDRYETAGRAVIPLVQYDLSTAETASSFVFDASIAEISMTLQATFFSGVFRPDDSVRAVIFLDACDALGIPKDVSRRVPFGRMLTIFASCFTLEKTQGTGSIRPNSAEWLKENVPLNAIPVHVQGEKKPKAQATPAEFKAALEAHYAEAQKIAPKDYPVKLAPKKGGGSSGKSGKSGKSGNGADYGKYSEEKAKKLVTALASANNFAALSALASAALSAIQAAQAKLAKKVA